MHTTEVAIAGAGPAGIVSALALLDRGRRVLLLGSDEPEWLGGLARESLGAMFFVDSPHQRRAGIRDSPELALRDWLSRAGSGAPDGDATPRPIPGVYAVGEAAGFGGGGMHGTRALESTFLGGCVLSGRKPAQAIARG